MTGIHAVVGATGQQGGATARAPEQRPAYLAGFGRTRELDPGVLDLPAWAARR